MYDANKLGIVGNVKKFLRKIEKFSYVYTSKISTASSYIKLFISIKIYELV